MRPAIGTAWTCPGVVLVLDNRKTYIASPTVWLMITDFCPTACFTITAPGNAAKVTGPAGRYPHWTSARSLFGWTEGALEPLPASQQKWSSGASSGFTSKSTISII